VIEIEFLGGRHGDSILMQWGPERRVMLIDGGSASVYEDVLRQRLLDLPHLPGQPPKIDVVCISHVDDDHIEGIRRLLREIRQTQAEHLPEPVHIVRVWYNSVDKLVDSVDTGLSTSAHAVVSDAKSDDVVAASYNQGEDVRGLTAALGLSGK
jgi:ribonuclease BN (tRNA processing enzyme)